MRQGLQVLLADKPLLQFSCLFLLSEKRNQIRRAVTFAEIFCPYQQAF